jgi:hypothetical protein
MSCADGCAADRESCLASGVCGTQIYCETCENQYNACLAACNSSGGGPCPTTTTATDHDTFTWFPHDYVCVGFGVTGSLYRKAQVTMKTTVTTTTRQCNGSTSQQTNVTYNDLYCYYYDTGQTCYSPPYPFVPACS